MEGGGETLGDLFQRHHEVTQFWVLGESWFFLIIFGWSIVGYTVVVPRGCTLLFHFFSSLAPFACLQF